MVIARVYVKCSHFLKSYVNGDGNRAAHEVARLSIWGPHPFLSSSFYPTNCIFGLVSSFHILLIAYQLNAQRNY